MSVQLIDTQGPEALAFMDNSQKPSASVILITTGSKRAERSIENAFRMAKRTGSRMVIALYSAQVSDEIVPAIASQKDEMSVQEILDGLVESAYRQGVQEVKTFQQGSWGEDELEDLESAENSICTILAL